MEIMEQKEGVYSERMEITEKGRRLQRKEEDYREKIEIMEKRKEYTAEDWRLHRKEGDYRE